MAKPVAPLLSFDARGSIAKTQVYSSWRGRSYVRRWTVPSNPRSVEQESTRHVFAWLSAVWKRSPADFQTPWFEYARGKPLTDRNALGKFNISNLRGDTDLSQFIFSPGAHGGLAPASMVVTPGSGQLSTLVTAPSLPTGWTIDNVFVAAILDQDPHTDTDYTISIGSDATSTYTVVLTGLTASVLYRVGAWIQWLKPDSSAAYSASLQSSGTPS